MIFLIMSVAKRSTWSLCKPRRCVMLMITLMSECGIGLDHIVLAYICAAGNMLSMLVVQKLTDAPTNLDHNQSECVINKADPSQVGLLASAATWLPWRSCLQHPYVLIRIRRSWLITTPLLHTLTCHVQNSQHETTSGYSTRIITGIFERTHLF